VIKWCDRVVIAGLGFLILFTPLAFGSVHPWAFAFMEAVIFFLLIVWMVRLLIAGSREQGAGRTESRGQTSDVRGQPTVVRGLLIPLFLFFVFVLFQLLSLPPGLIRLLSPSTFELYTHSLPGWTEGIQQGAGSTEQGGREQKSEVRGQTSEIREQLPSIPASQPASREQRSEIGGQFKSAIRNPQSAIPPVSQRSEVRDQKSEIRGQFKSAIRNPQSEIPPVILPTPDEVNSGVPVPFEQGAGSTEQGEQSAKGKAQSGREQRSDGSSNPQSAIRNPQSEIPPPDASRLTPDGFFQKWLPLSLAPSRTRSDLLKFASYAALFFLVLLYPFSEVRGQRSEISGQRSVVGGRKSAVRGRWSVVRGPWSAVSSPWSVVGGQQSAVRDQWSRLMLIVVTFSGLIVAVVGFIQRFTWNGKILWFFIPYDWGTGGGAGDLRASGPFINPDHFANYLALILPLALGLVIYSRHIFSKESQLAAKIFFSLIAVVAFTSSLLSLSRSGWMSAILGIALLFWMFPGRAEEESRPHSATKKVLVLRGSLLAVAILLIVGLFFVGPGGRQEVDSRLHETVTEDMGFAGRAVMWRDTFKMVSDFPFLGVGLGSWQDLYQRYQRAPWTPIFFREAHNDYLELLAETGVVGFLLLLLFFFNAGKGLLAHLSQSSDDARSKALVAMLLAALGTMTFHELFDFNLQIPANAFLFTLLLAIAVRIAAGSREQGLRSRDQRSDVRGQKSVVSGQWSVVRVSRFTPYAICALSAFLIVAAVRQEMTPYPYSLKMPGTLAEANEMILAHPALSTPHLYLLRLSEENTQLDWQLAQLRASLWLNPTDPYIRDQYARMLLGAGKPAEGLSEVTRSVLNAPSFAVHYYLNGRLLPWLSPAEKNAVESGFKKANALEYPEAMDSLAAFYGATERFADQGKLYEEAADRARDASVSADLFIEAAAGYLKAGDDKDAEALLRKAVARNPKDPRSYQMLATMIYGPRKETGGISKIISEGLKNGAPAFELYLALAEATHKAGALDEAKKALAKAKEALRTGEGDGQQTLRDYYSLSETAQKLGFGDEAKATLLAVLDVRSTSTETLLRLANLYFQENNLDRAAYYFRSYVEINPAAAVFYQLALAEERQYRFAAAEAAYKRAMELAPEVQGYRQGYEALRAKVAQNKKQEG
jgi:O-antigen ligase/tetratricopeptide (TPR) repeat protein